MINNKPFASLTVIAKRLIEKMENKRFNRYKGRRPDDEFESKLLDLARVSHTREGGKQLRFRAVMIVGDKKGKVGVGVASGLDVARAIEKATRLSKKNLIEVHL